MPWMLYLVVALVLVVINLLLAISSPMQPVAHVGWLVSAGLLVLYGAAEISYLEASLADERESKKRAMDEQDKLYAANKQWASKLTEANQLPHNLRVAFRNERDYIVSLHREAFLAMHDEECVDDLGEEDRLHWDNWLKRFNAETDDILKGNIVFV